MNAAGVVISVVAITLLIWATALTIKHCKEESSSVRDSKEEI